MSATQRHQCNFELQQTQSQYLLRHLFILSLFLYSLCPVSLFFSFSQLTFSRMVPPYEPGSAQGFFLLKVKYFAVGFGLWKAPRDDFIVKGTIEITLK